MVGHRLGRVLVARSGERVPKRAVVDAYRAFCAENCYEPTTSSSFGRFVCEVLLPPLVLLRFFAFRFRFRSSLSLTRAWRAAGVSRNPQLEVAKQAKGQHGRDVLPQPRLCRSLASCLLLRLLRHLLCHIHLVVDFTIPSGQGDSVHHHSDVCTKAHTRQTDCTHRVGGAE